jgi:multicomponent Na+:H+ antiporter subunit E
MTGVLWLLVLALAWTAVNGSFTGTQFLVGLALASLIMVSVGAAGVDYLRRGRLIGAFAVFFIVELVLANLRVARDVLSPRMRISPGVIAVPLDIRGPVEITAMANLLSLTPGTMSLDVSRDRTVLYVHGMWLDDPDEVRREIKEGFESWIKDLSG